MAQKNVNIKIKADGTQAEKGLDKITSKVNSLGKSLNKNQALSGFSKLGLAFTSLMTPLNVAVKGLKATVAAVKDLNEATLKQVKAEKSLEVAARNNPLLNKQSVNELKAFASELQKIGNYGDEELLPMMGKLAASGRTQAEIQNIMKAALDLSASGAMDMNTAVDALNKTYSGNVGYLTKVCSGVKDLTKEQLKQGDAVELIAKRYAGMSEELTKATGAGNQLKMAFGDLKEALGTGFTAVIRPLQFLLTGAVEKLTKLINGFNSIMGIKADNGFIGKKSDSYKTELDALAKDIEAKEKALNDLKKQAATTTTTFTQSYKDAEEFYNKVKNGGSEVFRSLSEEEKKQFRKLARGGLAALKEDSTTESYLQNNPGAANPTENTAQIKAAEEEILELKKQQEAAQQNYNAALEEEKLLTIDIDEAETDTSDKTDELVQKWLNSSKTEIEKVKEELELLQERKDLLEGKGLNTEEVQKAIKNCEDALNEMNFDAFMAKIQNIFSQISSITSQLSNGISKSVELAQTGADTQAKLQEANLNEQYSKGLISTEDFYKKKSEIEKKAAEKSYELEMWNWTAELLQATAQGALAVVNALSSTKNIYAGIAMAGLTASMVGVQMGALMAAKPVKPHFASGGIVPGNSYIGGRDTTTANLSSREMVLNMAQQKRLFNIANGSANGAGNTIVNIPIENTASDIVNVQRVNTNDGIKLVVQKIVNDAMNDGVFNSALKNAQSSFNGKNYY